MPYYPNTTLASITLPSGWKWEDDTILLDVGTNKYKAVYQTKEQYDYVSDTEMMVDVIITKSLFKINGVNITVNEGTKLSNDLLPAMNEGKLEFDEVGTEITKNGLVTCHFVPDDEVRYDRVNNIAVTINVVPKTGMPDTTTPTPPSNNESSSNRGNSNSGNTNGNSNNNPTPPKNDYSRCCSIRI